jgi:hypothetical protein
MLLLVDQIDVVFQGASNSCAKPIHYKMIRKFNPTDSPPGVFPLRPLRTRLFSGEDMIASLPIVLSAFSPA